MMLINKADPKKTEKPATIILVPRGDGRALKFKNLTDNFTLELSSHSELGLKCGPIVAGEEHSHEKEAFL